MVSKHKTETEKPITDQKTVSNQPIADEANKSHQPIAADVTPIPEPITSQKPSADNQISEENAGSDLLEVELGTKSKLATSNLLTKIRDDSTNETTCQSIASDENPEGQAEETITNISEPYEAAAAQAEEGKLPATKVCHQNSVSNLIQT